MQWTKTTPAALLLVLVGCAAANDRPVQPPEESSAVNLDDPTTERFNRNAAGRPSLAPSDVSAWEPAPYDGEEPDDAQAVNEESRESAEATRDQSPPKGKAAHHTEVDRGG